ncbi:MAG TPA: phosphotransferase, partial [Kineosporiaceae bacterium]|nr:phosphotransferase [Kineosporiaceae bacterium]
ALPAETYRLAAAPEVLGIAARLRPPDADVLSAALRAVWRPALPLVEEVVDRAAALGARLAARRAPEVICHNDPHLGNVVVDDEDGVWLLDWDDCLLAPRERDLVLVHDWAFPDCVPGQGAIGARELGWFREGYGDEPVDAELLAWFTAVRAVEELTWATRALDRDEDAAARAFALEIVRWQLSPSGVPATALRRMAAVAA